MRGHGIAIEFAGAAPDRPESALYTAWLGLVQDGFSAAIEVLADGMVQIGIGYPDGTSSYLTTRSIAGALTQGWERRRAWTAQQPQ